jgi:hypothetical protein
MMITVAMNGCAAHRSTFTPSAFEAAKTACGASDAYILKSDPKAIGFRGFSPAHAGQAKCLIERLKGTDARMIGFISEPPS